MSPLLFKRLSDESLGSRLASGEAAAFDELYRRYAHRLAAYGSHLLGDAASGDDVAQAAMLKAYAALRDGRLPARMKPWLYRIAHNVAIDLLARRRELPAGELPEQPTADREPFAGALVEALATLPERQRRVYVLREVHGLRMDETAAELQLTTPQVEQALFSARNRLAEQLVFGDRLNCVTVQRLAAGPLDGPERRALKTHLHSCSSCRNSLGVRARALSLLPSGIGFEWVRGLGTALIGGGAPAAAKVGAVVATATIAAGVPVAVEQSTRHHAHRPAVPSIAPGTAAKQAAAGAPSSGFSEHASALASAAVPVSAAASLEGETHHGARGVQETEHTRPAAERAHDTGTASGDGASHDGARSDGAAHDGALRVGGEHAAETDRHSGKTPETKQTEPQQTEQRQSEPQKSETQTSETEQAPSGEDHSGSGDTTDGHSGSDSSGSGGGEDHTTSTTTAVPTTTTPTTTTSVVPLPVPTL